MEYEVWVEKVTDVSQMKLSDFDFMPYEAVKAFADSVKEITEIRKTNGLILEMGAQDDAGAVNRLPIQNVMDRLSKYPRVRKMAW